MARIERAGNGMRFNRQATWRGRVGRAASYNDPRGEGLGSGFGTAGVVDESFAIGELLEDLGYGHA